MRKLTENVLRPGGGGKRYGLKVDLACPEAVEGPKPKKPGRWWCRSRSWTTAARFAYFDAAMDVSANASTFCLLVHEKPDFSIGKATRNFDKVVKAGKLRLFTFQEHPAAFQRIECLLRLLDKATAGDLSLGGKPILPDECRRLMISDRCWRVSSCSMHWAGRAPAGAEGVVTGSNLRAVLTGHRCFFSPSIGMGLMYRKDN